MLAIPKYLAFLKKKDILLHKNRRVTELRKFDMDAELLSNMQFIFIFLYCPNYVLYSNPHLNPRSHIIFNYHV